MSASDHTCHARRCPVAVAPKLLMCRKHWFMLPVSMRRALWAVYRPGQEVDKRPSAAYLAVQAACVDYVDAKERGPRKPALYRDPKPQLELAV